MDTIILSRPRSGKMTSPDGYYWDALESVPIPRWMPFSYDMVDRAKAADWPPFIEMMVSHELQDTINLLNAWGRHLFEWSIWTKVLPTFEEDDRMTVRMQHVDPLAFLCMHQPSATRDRLSLIATNAVHQANISTIPQYPDNLDQDELKPGRFLSRGKKELQLKRIGRAWSKFDAFWQHVESIDGKEYRQLTRNFRDRSSHAIAPSFELGITNVVTRHMTASTRMIPQADGRYFRAVDHTKMVVAYGFGGTPPLRFGDIISANRGQYEVAVSALSAYQALLQEMVDAIGPSSQEDCAAES